MHLVKIKRFFFPIDARRNSGENPTPNLPKEYWKSLSNQCKKQKKKNPKESV